MLSAGICRILSGVLVVTLASAAVAGDWPQFQHDAARTADATGDVVRTPLQPAWSVPISSEAFGFASAILTRTAAFAGTPSGSLLAIDPSAGRIMWSFQTDGAIHLAPAVSAGAVYFGGADGTLRALDAATGSILWARELGNNIHTSPALDGDLLFAASNSGQLNAVEAASGAVRWTSDLGNDYVWSSPAVDRGRVFVATLGGKLVAINRDTGAELWAVTLPAQVRSAPAVAGDSLYIGAFDGVFRALKVSDGSLSWSHSAAAPIVGSPAVSSTTVYLAAVDGKVTALSRTDGSVRWSFQVQGELYSSPALIDGVLVVGSSHKTLYFLDAATGAIIQSIALSGRIASAAAVSRGRIVVLTDDGVLHAFKSPNLPPFAPADLRVNGELRPAIKTASARLSWTFGDPDTGDSQDAFVLQISSTAAGFDPLIVDTGLITSSATAHALDSPLPEGTYFWRVQTYDLFSASSPFSSGTDSFIRDRTSPMVAISSPMGGETFIASQNTIQVSFTVRDNLDSAPQIDAALVQLQDDGSPRGSRADRVTVSNGTSLEPSSIDDGVWRLEITATDFAGNLSAAASGSFTVLHDVRPPRTTIAVSTPQAAGGPDGSVFVIGRTELNLSSIDDLVTVGDAIGLGVAFQRLSVNGVARATYIAAEPGAGKLISSTFTLASDPDGLYTLSAFAQDTLGNVEAERTATVAIDNTAPITYLSLQGGERSPGPDPGSQYVSSATRVAFVGSDPEVEGVASGLASTLWQDNGAGFQPFTAPLALTEGVHALEYRSADRLGNIEVLRSTTVLVDATAPTSSVALGSPLYGSPEGTQYVTPSTSLTITALDPALPSGQAGSGVSRIEVSIDGGPFVQYAAALTFAEGRHTVLYRAIDNVGNVEQSRTLHVRSDATAPPTSLGLIGGRQFPGPDASSFFASSDTLYSLPAFDPIVQDVASGLAFTRWQENGGAFLTYSSPFALSEGSHALAYQSQDNVQNLEVLRSTRALVDATAPETSLAIVGGVQYPGPDTATFYASSATRYALPSRDPVAAGVASGVGLTEYRDGGGPFTAFGQSFPLEEGAHQLAYRSQDNVGNLEVLRSTNPWVDATAPTSAFTIGAPTFESPDGTRFVTPATPVTFAASDAALPTGQPGSGVSLIEVSVDGGSFVAYAGPLTFPEGRHSILYRSIDNVGNVEAARALVLHSDHTPPITQLSLSGGRQASGPDSASFFASTATHFAFPAADPVVEDVASGLAFTRWRDGDADFQHFGASFTLAEGIHVLSYQSQDNVSNLEVLRSTTALVDGTAPRTSLAIVGGRQHAGPNSDTFYASSDTRLALFAIDPTVRGVASGVDFMSHSDAGAPAQVYAGPFGLAEGAHHIDYWSTDRVANVEIPRSTNVRVDATAPVTSVAIGSPWFVSADGTNYVTSATPITFSAADPALPGGQAGSGVARIEVALDGGPFEVYGSALTLGEGRHTIQYRSIDQVGNVEATRTLVVLSDNTPPLTALQASAGYFIANGPEGPRQYAPASLLYALQAADPAVAGVASGVAITTYRTDQGAFQTYSSAFTLTEGIRRVEFQSRDNVSNVEPLKSAIVFVDNTPPVTGLTIGLPRFDSGQTIYVATATLFSLATEDPVVEEVASGVRAVVYRRGNDAFGAFTGAFSLSLPDGTQRIDWYATDNVGNGESAKSISVFFDATPPQTSLSILGGRQASGPDAVTFYASSATRFALPATDPAVGGSAAGVAFTSFSDNAAWQTFATPFALSEGSHILGFRSQDRVENLEPLKSTNVWVDATPPATTWQLGTPWFVAPDGTNFVTPATPLTFTAADPALPTGEPGSGVERIEVGVDGGPFAAYSSALTFAEGRHVVLYRALDRVGNVEATGTLLLQSDATPPITTLGIVGGRQASGPDAASFFASPDTRYTLTAADPVVSEVASGVALTRWQDNGGPFEATSILPAFAEGSHALAYQSRDQVENLEVLRSTTVLVDATPPQTTLAVVGGRQFPGPDAGTFYASPDTRLALPARDPLSNGVASGLAVTRYQDNGGDFLVFGSPFGLAEGAHALAYRSEDRVGNLEVLGSTNVWVDATPPATSFQIGLPRFIAQDGTNYITPATPVSFTAEDPALPTGQPGSGVARIEVAVDGGPFATYSALLTFAEGRHTVFYRAFDNVGNEGATGTLLLQSDDTPPITSLSLLGGRQFAGPDAVTFYASSDTRISLPAIDPISAALAAGVAITRYQDNGGAFASFGSPFVLPEGSHVLAYQSQDNVEHLEALRSTRVWVDATPPMTSWQIGSPWFVTLDGTNYITPATPVTFSAADPPLPSGQQGSGVNRIEVSIDGGPFVTYSAALTFAEGNHSILYRSWDNVLNVEVTRTLLVESDASPPVTSLEILGGHQAPGPNVASFYASQGTRYALSAADPVVNGVASGVAWTRWQDNGGAHNAFASPIDLPEGVHLLGYQSQDNVENLEVLKSTTVLVDATAPQTALAIVGGRQYPGPDATTFYASSATRFELPAFDPSVNGVASGVDRTRYQDNGSSFQTFAASFALAEGAHALAYQSQDRVANLEVLRSTNVWLDATPPLTTAHVGSPSFVAADGTQYVSSATPISLAAADPAFPTGQPGSGVARIEVAIDGGTFAAYASALTFPEGRHTILYRAIDNVGNVEAERTLRLDSDATPPVTALGFLGGHQTSGPDALSFFASADTRFVLSEADPVSREVASGVDWTRWQDNAGPFAPFVAPIQLPEGVHRLAYHSADHVGNLEVARSTTALIDATPPATMLAVLGGRQFPGADGTTFYASSDTRFALPAVDPVVNGVASGVDRTRYQDNGGTLQTFVSPVALPEGAHALAYQSQDRVANLEVLRSTNIWIDATPPVSSCTIGSPHYAAPDGTRYITPATSLSLSALDPPLPTGQPGSGVGRIEVAIDGGEFALYVAPLQLSEGRHSLLYRAVDNVGNLEAAHALAVHVDATPPVSGLAIGQPQYQLSDALLVSSRTPIAILATDPVVRDVASGVKDTFYRVSDGLPGTAGFAPYDGAFTLSGTDVTKLVEFYSRDNVLNTESVRSSTVLLDSTPPELAFHCPPEAQLGICRVVTGRLPVLGTATDPHFREYRLEVAPGKDAIQGFAAIQTSAEAMVSGTLGTWDATGLQGWHTLRLSASDRVDNSAALSLNVWVGDPATLMLLGNHDVFKMPEGVAVGTDGRIYVADRNNDRIAVFTATGVPVASFGSTDKSTSALSFNKPAGVAVDSAGNVIVADTNNDRVIKFAPDGAVLLQLGRRNPSGNFIPGKDPGEFNKPVGVALDGLGRIHVADSENRRVQVFSSSGTLRWHATLPPASGAAGEDALGKPGGVAVDAAGRLYVTDSQRARLVVFAADGMLLRQQAVPPSAPDSVSAPFGVAVTQSGECVLVSDAHAGRILKFDRNGVQNLTFGQKHKIDEQSASGIRLRRPVGLAIDVAGNLYLADRNASQIKKFGLPAGEPTLVIPPPQPGDDLYVAKDVVTLEEGGTVQRKDKAAVVIPIGAVPEDLQIAVSTPSSARVVVADKNMKIVSVPVEFHPHGTQFNSAVTLVIPYDPNLVAAYKASEEQLQINYWNPDTSKWEQLTSVVDPVARIVTAKTMHFSLYQVMATTGTSKEASALGADSSFAFRELYVFPDPAIRGAAPTFHVAVGVADLVKLKVIDVAGRQVHAVTLDRAPTIIDDGSGAKYAYEYAWRGHIPSGVYFYTVEAEKGGHATIRKAGRFAVVR